MDNESKRKARWARVKARHAVKRAQIAEMAKTPGMTQAELARQLGLSRQRVNAILKSVA